MKTGKDFFSNFVNGILEKEIIAYFSKSYKTLLDVKHTATVLYDLLVRGKTPIDAFTSIYGIAVALYTIGLSGNFFDKVKGQEDVTARILIDVLVNMVYTDDIVMSQLTSKFALRVEWVKPSFMREDSFEAYAWFVTTSSIEGFMYQCTLCVLIPSFIKESLAPLQISDPEEVDRLIYDHHHLSAEVFGKLRDLQLDGLKNAYFTETFLQPPGTSWVFMDELLFGTQDVRHHALAMYDPRIATIRLGITNTITSLEARKARIEKYGVPVDVYKLGFSNSLTFHLLTDGTLCFDHFGFAPVEKYFRQFPGGKGLCTLLYSGLVSMYFDLTIPRVRVRKAPVPRLDIRGSGSTSIRETIQQIDTSVYELLIRRDRLVGQPEEIRDEQRDERNESIETEEKFASPKRRGSIHKHKPHFLKPVSDNYCAPEHVQELYRYYCKRNPDERIPLGYTFVRWGVLDDKDAPEILHRARHRNS